MIKTTNTSKKNIKIHEQKDMRFSIRFIKKINHPSIEIKKIIDEYDLVVVTHSEYRDKKSGSKNLPLNVNPNPNDKRKAYVEKKVRRFHKDNLGPVKKNWNVDKSDEKTIKNIQKNKNAKNKNKKVP